MDSETYACPACGQAVETVIRRHKTLGAWVPRWVPGPCRNPECEACVDAAANTEDSSRGTSETTRRRSPMEPA